MIDIEEIKRIIDDFETKAENYRNMAKIYFDQNMIFHGERANDKASIYDYCARVVRQALLQ